jgi:predicted TPR repeat methyltransferase
MKRQEDATFLQKESSLRQILEKKPRNAKVRSQLASLLAERSKEVGNEKLKLEAIALAEQAVEIAPQKPFGYAALSAMCQEESRRMIMLQKAIDFSSEKKHPVACVGLLLRRLVEPREDEARRVRGKIGRGSKNHPNKRNLNKQEESWYEELALALTEVWGQPSLSTDQKDFLAKNEYKLGLFFRKKEPPTVHKPRARKCLEMSLQHSSPSHSEMANFWLATMDDVETNKNAGIAKCPAEYIVGLYSTFANNFDELLVEKLDYQTPTKLRQLFNECVDSKTPFDKALDLGCGTGISGAAFRDVITVLHGVDLSPEMIEKAKNRNCYDRLQVDDVVRALKTDEMYDLIFACDVFCYIGDLSEIFDAVIKSLSPDGFFCFSTEYLEEEEEEFMYKLHSCARFAHKQSYVRDMANKKGFGIVSIEITSSLRKNQGENVKGMLAVLKPQ